jgi:hypothetical protein
MSNATTRTRIAAALNTVSGINGYDARPHTIRAGDGWPQWSGGIRDETSVGFEETWRVMVVCSQASANDADRFLDSHGQQLLDALAPILFVDGYAPAKLETEAGDLYALMITGRTE